MQILFSGSWVRWDTLRLVTLCDADSLVSSAGWARRSGLQHQAS